MLTLERSSRPSRDSGAGSPSAATRNPPPVDRRMDAASLKEAIRSKLTYKVGKLPDDASDRDWFVATALAVRDQMVDT